MHSRFLLKTLLVVSLFSFFNVYGGTNVLVNPDFEEGTQGWYDRSCKIEAVTSPVQSGSGSMKVSGRGETWQGIRQPMLEKMVPGETYQISGWVKLENAPSAPLMVSFEMRDDSGTKYPNVASGTATDSNWVELAGTFTVPEGALASLDIYFEGPPAGVSFFVDNVKVLGAASKVVKEAPKPAEPNAVCAINLNKRHQIIEGFGAAGAYYTMEFVNHKQKDELYRRLFKELDLDIFRIRNNHEMEPNSFVETAEIVKGAKAIMGGDIKIMISSWSPPASLKSENNTVGGTLAKKDGKFMYDAFAQWWYESIAAYEKAGVEIDYINIQNEPDFLAKWDSCRFDPTESDEIAGYNKAFTAVWQILNEKMGENMPKMLAPEAYGMFSSKKYINSLEDLSKVYGYAHHLYDCSGNTDGCGTEPDMYLKEMRDFRDNFGDKPLFQTEYQHREEDEWSQALNTAILMHNSLAVEDVAGYLYWDLFWGPGNAALMSIDNPSSYTLNAPYFAFKQYSAFIDCGWQRVEASTDNTGLRITAFISPDNQKLTAVIINTTEDIDIDGDFYFKGWCEPKGEIYRSSRNEKCVLAGCYKDSKSLKLPANSITTLVLEKN